jgi:hypothetical protein
MVGVVKGLGLQVEERREGGDVSQLREREGRTETDRCSGLRRGEKKEDKHERKRAREG